MRQKPIHKCYGDGTRLFLTGKDGMIYTRQTYASTYMSQCQNDKDHLIFPHQQHFHYKNGQCRIKKTTSEFDLSFTEELKTDPPKISEFPEYFDKVKFMNDLYDFASVSGHIHFCPRDEWSWRLKGGVIQDFIWHFARRTIQRCRKNERHWILPHQESIHGMVCKGQRSLSRWRSEDWLIAKSRQKQENQKVSKTKCHVFCVPMEHSVSVRFDVSGSLQKVEKLEAV